MYIDFSNSIYFIYIFFIHFNIDVYGEAGATFNNNFNDGIELKSQDGLKFPKDPKKVYPSKGNSEDDIIESLEKGILLTMLRRKPLKKPLRKNMSDGHTRFPVQIESLEELPIFRLPDVYSAPREFPKIEDHIFDFPNNMEFPKLKNNINIEILKKDEDILDCPNEDDDDDDEDILDCPNEDDEDDDNNNNKNNKVIEESKAILNKFVDMDPLPEKPIESPEFAHKAHDIGHSTEVNCTGKNDARNLISENNVQVNKRVIRFAKLNLSVVSEIIASFFLLAVVIYVKMVLTSRKMKNSGHGNNKHKELSTEEI